MGDSFSTNGIIILQPGSATVPYAFTFAAATSATANDGSIPNGTTIASSVSKAYDAAGNDVTAEIIVSESNTTLVVSLTLKYPATSGAGNYSLEILLSLSTGAVIEVDFTRVYAKDIAA